MRATLEEISKKLQTQDPKSEINLFRKQFGNLKDCMKNIHVDKVFKLDGNILYFQSKEKLEQALKEKHITSANYELFLKANDIFWISKLSLYKQNGQNICKICNLPYVEKYNVKGDCNPANPHFPKYDFLKSTNVLDCII